MAGENFSKWEDKLVLDLEVQGNTHYIRMLEENPEREMSVEEIKKKLKTATPEQITAVIAALR